MRRKLAAALLALGMLLALCGCAGAEFGVSFVVTGGASGAAAQELTPEEAVERVRALLEENSGKLCPNEEGLQAVARLELEPAGETTVGGEACHVVQGGGASFALRKDGAVLYEWEPVSGSYVLVTEEQPAVPAEPD